MALLAGAATVDITPPPGGQMDGYGNRTQPSTGVHDPLFARILVLDDGASPCAIVGCDLLGMHPGITAEVRDRVTSATGIAPEAVLVAATHSHAGPRGLRGGMFSRLDEPLAAEIAEKVSNAIVAAYEARRPAILKLGQAHLDTVSMNRRHPDWPSDPILRVLLIDGIDAPPVATLLNFACHATITNGSNLLLSAEFPGAACRIVQEHTEAPCVYLNGACGNVNPVWIKQDFDSVARVGQIIGGQALRTVGELRTLGAGQRAHNIRWDEFPEKPVPGRIVEPALRATRQEIELPLRPFDDDATYAEKITSLENELSSTDERSTERRDVMAQLTCAQTERWAALWARQQDNPSSQRTEIQALRLGEGLAIVGLPGEFFVETATALRAASGIDDLLVACYANDYVGYVIPEDAYAQGGYESGATFCAENAERMIADAATTLLASL
ncbi:MAG: neutral/alkaline non-lysosomal ceramidase N-terminal domain-containing protein [Chloroflexi bacterium]|nr:neutral/alkaline non-lysosomal ceramidase N-terminal domain-containing protein [Chloroflexota bacterium]